MDQTRINLLLLAIPLLAGGTVAALNSSAVNEFTEKIEAWIRRAQLSAVDAEDPAPNPAPEPTTLALLAMGLFGMIGSRALRKERPGSGDFQGTQGA